MKKIIVGGLAALAIGLGMAPAAQADPFAVPGMGCETIHWGFLGSQLRSVCDGPRQADGSWTRLRVVWVRAHHVPYRVYCGSYSCSSSGGYDVDDQLVARESYVVFDSNVLPDEPGWLPPGTATVR
jgi:hypothetical protein